MLPSAGAWLSVPVEMFPLPGGGLVILRLPQADCLDLEGSIRFGADGMLHHGLGDKDRAVHPIARLGPAARVRARELDA